MTRNSTHGDWTKLTYYLHSQYPNVVTLTDEQIAEITGSTDIRQTDSFFPFDDNPTWSIKQRAADAGYSVNFAPRNKRAKVFTPILN